MDLYTVRKNLNMGISLSNMKLRVTDYARVSTDHLEQKKSLQNQVEHFEKYIKNNPNWIYVDGYIDDGYSGTSDIKRNNFMQMIEDARLGKFDLIITKEISRFSRNTLDSIKYTRELLNYGVAVLFVNDNINTAIPDSELRLTIMASIAQDEIRRLSERVKFGMNRAIERGEILGNNLLYGYRKDKNTGNLLMVEKEAQIIRKIFNLYAIKKYSLSRIAKELNNDYLYINKKFTVTSISRIIENPKYKGFYCAKKTEIVDYMTKKIKHIPKENWVTYENKKKIPSIISKELWEMANKRLESRKRIKRNFKKMYLYSSKIICGEDNAIFYRRCFRRNKKDVTWVCSKYLKNGKAVCDTPNIREKELDTIWKDIIKRLQIDIGKIKKTLINLYYEIENRNQNIEIQNINLDTNGIQTFIINSIISILLDHITVSKIDKNKIKLDVYLKYQLSNKELIKSVWYINNYHFKRGYDTTSTKRYDINYLVSVYIS